MDPIVDTVIAIETSDDLPSIQQAISQPLGYDRFVLFSASPARDELVEKIFWVEGDWFGDGETVDAQTYVRRCPVTRHVLERDEPFFWTKTVSAGGEKYRVAGIHGLQVPIFGRAGLEGAMSFGGTRIDGAVRTRLMLTIVGAAAFRSARRLIEAREQKGTVNLSARERKCCAGSPPAVAKST
ncbi:autoinducer binding domain-containing protein [Mesorhizobium argentiipisi]|uniref:Autoinducer binding domain-containing protein n=1 Tax=Mesorhizobium argentiipisi TaxID=3015175 RepID=A0ABU8KBV9_9HYPH